MKKKIAGRWVEALRSGKYSQTREQLRCDEPHGSLPAGFCCLGVLCDLHDPNLWEGESYWFANGMRENGTLPPTVKEWAGMQSADGRIGPWGKALGNLAAMNDAGSTFPQLADLIEQHWEAL